MKFERDLGSEYSAGLFRSLAIYYKKEGLTCGLFSHLSSLICFFRNLWNFSPKHFFTDSSGHFWRERRLPTGIYTDGVEVCEIVYNYPGGRNGIRPLCLLQDYMKRNATDVDSKEKVVVQLRKQNEDRNRKLLSADFLKLCGPANQKVNERIMKRLKEDAPDIVLEFDKSWIQLKTTSLRQA